jgi:hypothetical protein
LKLKVLLLPASCEKRQRDKEQCFGQASNTDKCDRSMIDRPCFGTMAYWATGCRPCCSGPGRVVSTS